MKVIPFFLLLMISCSWLNAQLQESFSDGDFTNNPMWLGDTDHFQVVDGHLQLNMPSATGSTTSFLSVKAATSLEERTVWRFSLQLHFAPSANNRVRIYLGADRPELFLAEKAYYLEIGESGSQDAIRFFVKNQNGVQLLARGSAGVVAQDTVTATIEIRREPAGRWVVLADHSDTGEFREEFSVSDTSFSVLQYFGFWCQYSPTRSRHFLFDDISIDPLFTDHAPPKIIEINAPSAQLVRVVFDEALDSSTAGNPQNYQIDKGIGMPQKILFEDAKPNEVSLSLAQQLLSTEQYRLTLKGIRDLNGNVMAERTSTFIFYDIQQAAPGDIVISEIMADPSPGRGLPEAEYFELYNLSEKVLQLNELMISSGNSFQVLPHYLLLPRAYVAICDDDDVEAFSEFGAAIGLKSLPVLSNTDIIDIANPDTNLIFTISYDQSWYDPVPLPTGGVSLEIISPEGPSDCPGNWVASRGEFGGTPGKVNSTAGIPHENIPPTIETIEVLDEYEIRLTFSEKMDQNSILSTDVYSFIPQLGITEVLPGMNREVNIFLSNPLVRGRSYKLNLSNSARDCIGNAIKSTQSFRIGLPEQAEAGDLLLSEILFDPHPGGKDFIEIFNRSDKVINLRGWIFENTLKDGGNTSEVFKDDFLVFPQDYVVISEGPDDLLNRYQVAVPDRLLKNGLPTLGSKTGNITLLRPDSTLIDALEYKEDFHFSLLENTRGVSLERISFDQATQSSGNWHSAAESAGFATPTAPNSQNITGISGKQSLVSIENPRFSPDSDGFEDLLLININPDHNGYVANIKIFDVQGRLVRDLVNSSILGKAEIYKWDGFTNENSKARIGPYVVWIELFEPEGRVITEKKTIVLAGKL